MLLKNPIFSIFIASVALVVAQNRNVQNFRMATWNTAGGRNRWQPIVGLMNTGIDILAIQEAGAVLDGLGRTPVPTTNSPELISIDGDGNNYMEFDYKIGEMGFHEFLIDGFWVYYYERNMCQDDRTSATTSVARPARKLNRRINAAIVSRHRASSVMFLPPQLQYNPNTLDEAETNANVFNNRPTFGIRIENSFFFNIHAEPSRQRNEVNIIIRHINGYMHYFHPLATWILMGDFNREPNQIQNVPAISNSMAPTIVQPNLPTHHNPDATLDFGIIGGPLSQQAAMSAILAVTLIGINQPNGPAGRSISDHTPVRFNT